MTACDDMVIQPLFTLAQNLTKQPTFNAYVILAVLFQS